MTKVIRVELRYRMRVKEMRVYYILMKKGKSQVQVCSFLADSFEKALEVLEHYRKNNPYKTFNLMYEM